MIDEATHGGMHASKIPTDPSRAVAALLTKLDEDDKDTLNWMMDSFGAIRREVPNRRRSPIEVFAPDVLEVIAYLRKHSQHHKAAVVEALAGQRGIWLACGAIYREGEWGRPGYHTPPRDGARCVREDAHGEDGHYWEGMINSDSLAYNASVLAKRKERP